MDMMQRRIVHACIELNVDSKVQESDGKNLFTAGQLHCGICFLLTIDRISDFLHRKRDWYLLYLRQ